MNTRNLSSDTRIEHAITHLDSHLEQQLAAFELSLENHLALMASKLRRDNPCWTALRNDWEDVKQSVNLLETTLTCTGNKCDK